MTKQIKALVKPAMLRWARESLNLPINEAAKKIGVKPSKLSAWESGESSPTIGQLRKAGAVYERPLAVFFLSQPPRDFDALRDFRRLPDPTQAAPSPELNLEIRRAHVRRETTLELTTALGIDPPRLPAVRSSLRDSDRLAQEARQILGVSLQQQCDWRGPYEPLHGWISALERVGVLVFQTGAVSLDEMRLTLEFELLVERFLIGSYFAEIRIPCLLYSPGFHFQTFLSKITATRFLPPSRLL